LFESALPDLDTLASTAARAGDVLRFVRCSRCLKVNAVSAKWTQRSEKGTFYISIRLLDRPRRNYPNLCITSSNNRRKFACAFSRFSARRTAWLGGEASFTWG
jgi:hypothetical protein